MITNFESKIESQMKILLTLFYTTSKLITRTFVLFVNLIITVFVILFRKLAYFIANLIQQNFKICQIIYIVFKWVYYLIESFIIYYLLIFKQRSNRMKSSN